MRYRITATQGSEEDILARGWYEAKTPLQAVKLFRTDNPDRVTGFDLTADGTPDCRGQIKWTARTSYGTERALFAIEDPEHDHEKLGACTKCGDPAVWRFTYTDTDKTGTSLTLMLCKRCHKLKNITPVVKQAFGVSGCKKHTAAWWRKQGRQ